MADAKISALPAATTALTGTEVVPIVQSGSTKRVSVANLTAGRDVAASTLALNGAAQAGYTLTVGGAIYTDSSNHFFAGQLGIGTTPVYSLDVVRGAGAGNLLRVGQSGLTNGFQIISDGSNLTYTFNTGNVVIGTAAKGINFTANTPAAGMTSQLLNWYEEGTWTPSIGATTTNPTTPITGTGRYTRVGRQVTVSFTVSGDAAGAAGTLFISGLPFTASSSGLGYGPCTMSGLGTDVAVLRINNSDNYATLMTVTTSAFVSIVATTISVNGTVTYLV